jgi:hypothetical protein
MIATTTPNRVLARAFRVLIVLEALSFLCFALLHLGVLNDTYHRVMVVVLGVGLLLLLTHRGRARCSSTRATGQGARQESKLGVRAQRVSLADPCHLPAGPRSARACP